MENCTYTNCCTVAHHAFIKGARVACKQGWYFNTLSLGKSEQQKKKNKSNVLLITLEARYCRRTGTKDL